MVPNVRLGRRDDEPKLRERNMEPIVEIMPPGEDHDPADRYWNAAIETMPFDQLRGTQVEKLKKQLFYLEQNSEFYRDVFKSVGFEAAGFKRLEDLDALPFTTKSDLRESQEREPPFGRHVAAPFDRLIRVTTTAGTTGRAVVQTYTRRDVQLRNEAICRVLWSFGVRPGDRIVNGFSLSMFNAGIPFCAAVEHMGAVDVPVGTERKAEGLLRIARDIGATVLICTPSFAAYLAERCKDVLGIPSQELGIRIVCGGGEPGFELPGMRERLEEAFGTRRIFDLASSSDAHPNSFANCHVRCGKHHLTGDLVLVQLIDPASGAPMELRDGAFGEYIFTHLDRQACPLLRYRTNDLIRVTTSPCDCGRTGFRIDLVGRSDDMLLVRGMNVFPSAVQSVVSSFAPKTTGMMQIVVDRPGPVADPPLHVDVELNEGIELDAAAPLKLQLDSALRQSLNVTTNVHLRAFGELERTAGKTRLVVVKESGS